MNKLTLLATMLGLSASMLAETPITREMPQLPARPQKVQRHQSPPMRVSSEVINPMAGNYYEPFDEASSVNDFTILDVNGDSKKWIWADGVMRIQFNNSYAMNDWLITRPVQMEAGTDYTLEFDVRGHSPYYAEKIEVKMGSAPTAAGMTTQVLPVMETSGNTFVTKSTNINVAQSGTYYIGFHACSPAGTYYLYLDNISIKGPDAPKPPVAPVVTAKPDYDGAKKAHFTITAPTKDETGADLTAISKITLRREGTLVHTIDNPTPGQTIEYTDVMLTGDIGYYNYTVTAYNEQTPGADAEVRVHLGPNVPAAPSEAWAQTAVDADGEFVGIAWEPVTKDIDGFDINPSLVTYNIFSNRGELLAEDLTNCYWEGVSMVTNQRYYFYIIEAETAGGLNDDDYAMTNFVVLGQPYAMPVVESFTGGSVHTAWAIEGGKLELVQKIDSPLINATDSDSGLAKWSATESATQGLLMGGKIIIPTNAVNPVMTFEVYGRPDAAPIDIKAMVNASPSYPDADYAQLFTTSSAGHSGWQRFIVPLSEYKGLTLKPGFLFTAQNAGDFVAIDDVRVLDMLNHNLIFRGIAAPSKSPAGQPVQVRTMVENFGALTTEGYTVSLLRNGEEVSTIEGPVLASGERVALTLTDNPTVVHEGELNYAVRINYDLDQDVASNLTRTVTTQLIVDPLPRVQQVAAADASGDVALTWQPIDLTTARCQPLTEDFEDYTAFAINQAGPWSFVDVDQSPKTWGISGLDFPNEQLPMAWLVFNCNDMHYTYAAHSGSQYMVSMAARPGDNNDWMISPELDGKAQTIDFYVSSASTSYGSELYQVLTSEGSMNTTDFTVVHDGDNVPAIEWDHISVDLPEGARRFAIRSYECKLMTKIDDVTYIPALPEGLTLVGYNIYRDGLRLNDEPVTTTSYAAQLPAGEAVYHVTAVYNHGESGVSAPCSIVSTAVSDMTAATGSVRATRGSICISDCGRYSIINMQGMTVATGDASATTRIHSLPAGLYVVRTDNANHKVFVR